MLKNARLLVLFIALPLTACGSINYDAVKKDVLAEYPSAQIISIFGEMVPRLDSVLRYSADVRITLIQSGSTSKETFVWYYHYSNDVGDTVRGCKCAYAEYQKAKQ